MYIQTMIDESFVPLNHINCSVKDSLELSQAYYNKIKTRRSVRFFDAQKKVPKEVIKNIIKTASTAPSGANKQPWHFCAVSNQKVKEKIRKAAEKEEYLNYNKRMSREWLLDLKPLGTTWKKPMLTDAPWLIVVFRKIYDELEGKKRKNYYINESVGISCGFLLTAIHEAGLVSLTHTPSPMNFLINLLKRPVNERAYLLLPVGFPSKNCKVPNIKRKNLDEVATFIE